MEFFRAARDLIRHLPGPKPPRLRPPVACRFWTPPLLNPSRFVVSILMKSQTLHLSIVIGMKTD